MARIRTRANLSAKASGGLLLAATALLVGILAVRFWPDTPVAGGDPVASDVAETQPPGAVETVPPDAAETLPPDEFGPGSNVRPLAPEGMISREQALDVARREDPEVFEEGQIAAYLIELTDPHLFDGLKDRPIWLIKATGLSLDVFSLPYLPDRTPGEVPKAHLAYIYVDAITGEWLTSGYSGSKCSLSVQDSC